MNATGTKMTTSDSVVAMTASPISEVASMAACFGVAPFSSTNRKMFSSTTIASSMTMPVASDSASIVMLLSVKSSARITAKVPMMEIGMARPAISVTRRLRMKRKTTSAASTPPSTRCIWISSNDLRMKRDWSRVGLTRMSDGSAAWIRSSRSSTRSTTVTVLVPDCLRIDIETAFSPSRRVWLRTSSFASVTRATSPSVMTEPSL